MKPLLIALAALLAALFAPSTAAAWGKHCYYSYSSDRSATYTSESSDRADKP